MKSIVDYTNKLKDFFATKQALTTSNTNIAYINTSSTTASKGYSQGEQFILDGILRKAKTAIASGATLTLNSNYENAENVTTQIQNEIFVKGYTGSVTVAANGSASVIENITHSGYTPIGIVGCEATNTFLAIARMNISNATTTNITFHNTANSEITSNIAYLVLYKAV